MKRPLPLLGLTSAIILALPLATTPIHLAASTRPNVVIIITDDQRWDKVTPEYMPNVAALAASPNAIRFTNAFVSNPLCCPSRTTILTGRYSHTTGVWTNDGPYGGYASFDDRHTLAVDFRTAGYRTAMIGKYLNGYDGGRTRRVPPGWSRWFAIDTRDYYDYGATTNHGVRTYGDDPSDYSTRVLQHQAIRFIDDVGDNPFFMYFASTAPHGPAIPDRRDVGRFAGEEPYLDFHHRARTSSMLASAYGVDRAVGHILAHLPSNTIVLFLSDNGYMWSEPEGDRGLMSGKSWPYNASARVPMIYASLDGQDMPVAGAHDLVANVDIRTSLLHAVGLAPLTRQEGINWFAASYAPRTRLLLEHGGDEVAYCAVRTVDHMYARFLEDGGYTEELYAEPDESKNLIGDASLRDPLAEWTRSQCKPNPPPGYGWP